MPYIGAISETALMDDIEAVFEQFAADVVVVREDLSPGSVYETRQIIFADIHAERAIILEVGDRLPVPISRTSIGFDRTERVFDINCTVEQLCEALSVVVEFVE